MNKSYDVVVIGGGSAGVIAAIQSAREGVSTLLIEKNGILGGTITTCAVNFPGLFNAKNTQVIAGIGWELVSLCLKESGRNIPDLSKTLKEHWKQQIHIDRNLYSMLCDEAVIDSGADILFHTMIADITESDSIKNITICTKTGLEKIQTEVIIDCTGDANAVMLAGYPVNIIKNDIQPGTQTCIATGYDAKKLDYDTLNMNFKKAVEDNELEYTDACWNLNNPNIGTWLHNFGTNANHINHINAYDSIGKTEMELAGRKSLLRLYRFLRKQPGLENIKIDFMSTECGVRETCTIQGQKTVSLDDYYYGKQWEDAICYSFYPIDLHTSSETGLDVRPLPDNTYPTIPKGSMLPENSRNFIAAGRIISSDRLANSALRVQATCMAVGQAAGAMAALAIQKNQDVATLDIKEIHTILKKHNAIIPGEIV